MLSIKKLQMANKGEHTDRASVFIKSRRNKKGETSEETASILVSMEINFNTLITMVQIM